MTPAVPQGEPERRRRPRRKVRDGDLRCPHCGSIESPCECWYPEDDERWINDPDEPSAALSTEGAP